MFNHIGVRLSAGASRNLEIIVIIFLSPGQNSKKPEFAAGETPSCPPQILVFWVA
jgi:hypothetical protein